MKKILAIVLAVVMLLPVFAVNVFAADGDVLFESAVNVAKPDGWTWTTLLNGDAIKDLAEALAKENACLEVDIPDYKGLVQIVLKQPTGDPEDPSKPLQGTIVQSDVNGSKTISISATDIIAQGYDLSQISDLFVNCEKACTVSKVRVVVSVPIEYEDAYALDCGDGITQVDPKTGFLALTAVDIDGFKSALLKKGAKLVVEAEYEDTWAQLQVQTPSYKSMVILGLDNGRSCETTAEEILKVLQDNQFGLSDVAKVVTNTGEGKKLVIKSFKVVVPAPPAIVIGETVYSTLQEAINSAESGDVISVNRDIVGSAVTIPADKDVTIDFNTHRYTVAAEEATKAASKNAVSVLGTLTMMNGTLADSASDAAVYCEKGSTLTLVDMTISSTKVGVVSCGASVTVSGKTNIAAEIAIDMVYDADNNSAVTVNTTGTINGNILLENFTEDAEFDAIASKLKLDLQAGTFNGSIVADADNLNFEPEGEEEPAIPENEIEIDIAKSIHENSTSNVIMNKDGSVTINTDGPIFLQLPSKVAEGTTVKYRIKGNNATGKPFRTYFTPGANDASHAKEPIVINEAAGEFDEIITLECIKDADCMLFKSSWGNSLKGSTISYLTIYTDPKPVEPVEPEYEVTTFEKPATLELYDGFNAMGSITIEKSGKDFVLTSDKEYNSDDAMVVFKGKDAKVNLPEGVKIVIKSIDVAGTKYTLNDKYDEVAGAGADKRFEYGFNTDAYGNVVGPISDMPKSVKGTLTITFDVVDPNAKPIVPEEPDVDMELLKALCEALAEKGTVTIADGTVFSTASNVKLFGVETFEANGQIIVGSNPNSYTVENRTIAFVYVTDEYHAMLVGGRFLVMPHMEIMNYCPMCHAFIEPEGDKVVTALDIAQSQDFNDVKIADGIALVDTQSGGKYSRIATNWVNGGASWTTITKAITENPDSWLKITYTGNDIKAVVFESSKDEVKSFETVAPTAVKEADDKKALYIKCSDLVDKCPATLANTWNWANFMVEYEGETTVYGVEVVNPLEDPTAE